MHASKTPLLLTLLLAACGAPTAATPAASPSTQPAADAPPGEEDAEAQAQKDEEAAAAKAEKEEQAAAAKEEAAEKAADEAREKGAKALECLEEAYHKGFQDSGFNPGLSEFIEKTCGPATKKGTGRTTEYWYEKVQRGKTWSCSTLTIVETATGTGAVEQSVYTGDKCKPITATEKQVKAVMETYEKMPKHPYDKVRAAFDAALGKPVIEKSGAFTASWKYQGTYACQHFVVFDSPFSGAATNISDAPCE